MGITYKNIVKRNNRPNNLSIPIVATILRSYYTVCIETIPQSLFFLYRETHSCIKGLGTRLDHMYIYVIQGPINPHMQLAM